MAARKRKGRKRDPRLKRAGVSGYNKPKRTPGHPKKVTHRCGQSRK